LAVHNCTTTFIAFAFLESRLCHTTNMHSTQRRRVVKNSAQGIVVVVVVDVPHVEGVDWSSVPESRTDRASTLTPAASAPTIDALVDYCIHHSDSYPAINNKHQLIKQASKQASKHCLIIKTNSNVFVVIHTHALIEHGHHEGRKSSSWVLPSGPSPYRQRP
jgi:hypothetical protein